MPAQGAELLMRSVHSHLKEAYGDPYAGDYDPEEDAYVEEQVALRNCQHGNCDEGDQFCRDCGQEIPVDYFDPEVEGERRYFDQMDRRDEIMGFYD